ncbi:hypothetical protein C4A75_09500 [Brevibacillus laterosporus]|uniref:Uncharacterized protein n=1 Tax=Brevibacillus laterosporus TaxID=1465 RepID=A0AAP8U737_BRELA|nr:hypothetical protein [Brevibacillus laterosporus]PPA85002.1 hypothetical protein C4A75_09500 [Brevibacillus laterosporus]PPB12898.1 hypothetical protein C4A77_00495 [Brevibacillus laterosporus]
MEIYAVGICKKEFSEMLEPFIGVGFQKEYKVKIGDRKTIYSDNLYNESDQVYFYIRHKKIQILKEQLENLFEIDWKFGCYNTCIRDGVHCVNLPNCIEDASHLSLKKTWTCNIGWEIGRADCCEYSPVRS